MEKKDKFINLIPTETSKTVDFFGSEINGDEINKKIEEKRREESINNTLETEIDINQSKSSINKIIGWAPTERRLVTLEKDVIIALDSIEEIVRRDSLKKYGNNQNLFGVKKDVINKVIKLGLKSIGIKVD